LDQALKGTALAAEPFIFCHPERASVREESALDIFSAPWCAAPPFSRDFPRAGNWIRFSLQRSLREAIMPVYDYVCKDCHHSFETVLTLGEHDKGDISCPKCESKDVEQDAVAFYAVTSKKS
jgi:putative FmdB family regulatory protein